MSKDVNPYLDAKREWNLQFGSAVAHANNWRLIALISMVIAAVSVMGLVTLGARTKIVPYVAVVDKVGNTLSAGVPGSEATLGDPRVVKSLVANFITNFRTVTADGAAQQHLIKKLYAMLSSQDAATRIVSQYFKGGGDPFKRAETATVSVKVSSILPLSDTTYQIEWTEITRDRQGKEIRRTNWQAQLTLRASDSVTEADLIANPLGLYVSDFSWTERI